jgi:hypothetical protein
VVVERLAEDGGWVGLFEVLAEVGQVRRSARGADRPFHEPRDGARVDQVALDLVAAPPQSLKALARDPGALNLRARIPVNQFETR